MKKSLTIIFILFVVFCAVYFIFFKNKPSSRTVINDQILVENYIRENVANLAPEQPVLGGTWYVVETFVNVDQKQGYFIYEDGHIQGRANFTYNTESGNVVINIIK